MLKVWSLGLFGTLIALVLFQSTNSLKVLGISSCYTGHVMPHSGIFRALVNRGHNVDLLMGGDCCETKMAKVFPNASSCNSVTIYGSHEIVANNQIEGLFSVRETFAENGTGVAFRETNKFLRENSDYDVIMTDFIILGAHIAAELTDVPIVAMYLGPFAFPLEGEEMIPLRSVFLPGLPTFLVEFIEIVGVLIYQLVNSEKVYEMVNDINSEFNMEPKLRNAGIRFFLPFVYYYYFANLIHMGPPDLFLSSLDFMKHKNNFHHVGYIPDEVCFQPLSAEVQDFIAKAEKPIVYMSLGTVFQMELSKLQNILEELASQTTYSIIWSASDLHHKQLKAFNVKGPNFLLVNKIAQLSLLMDGRTKVFITHAGANSLQEGIYSETPMLVFPGFGDQPFNAHQLVEHNLALPLVELSFAEISRKMELILSPEQNAQIRDSLKKSKNIMTSLGGFEKAAEIVEQVERGEIKVVDPPRLVDVAEMLYFMLYLFLGVLTSTVVLFFMGLYYCCCRKRTAKKENLN